MSKMKHFLRKLHIGTANATNTTTGTSDHSRHRRRSPSNHRYPSPVPATPPSSSSSVSSPPPSADPAPPGTAVAAVEVGESGGERNAVDFTSMEEEFQVQLAMALSASDPEPPRNDDVESNQIKAAKQMSLACSPSVPDNERVSEFLSLKYWNYNAVQYDEKLVDGFYDVYAVASKSTAQGEMPLLVDLRAVSVLNDGEYEVVLVNRSVDVQLRQLENKVYAISVEYGVLGHGLLMNGLIQRIAKLVVDRMGGPVGDAEEIMKRWRVRINRLKGSLNTVVLPLGVLDVGLSRHRALLFKVLADRVNLPCMLVKGSLYTGTDEGAVNLIKFDDGSEYIIDLMGAPGTLIPVEVPSSFLLNTALEAGGFSDSAGTGSNLNLVFDRLVGLKGTIPYVKDPEVSGPNLKEKASVSALSNIETEISVKSGSTERSENDKERPVRSEISLLDALPSRVEEVSLAQEKKVKDVSKYVISAAKDPEFAQKLRAVLLESGASPPPDLFSNMNTGTLDEKKLLGQIQPVGQEILFSPGEYRLKNELSLQCHSMVLPLCNFDDKKEDCVDNSGIQQLPLDTNAVFSPLCSEPNNGNVGPVAVEGNTMITSGAVGVDLCPFIPSKVEWSLNEEVPDECSRDTAAKSQGEVPGLDAHTFLDTRGKVINQVEAGEETAGNLVEIAQKECLNSCNRHSESSGLVSGEVFPMLGEFAEWEIPWEDLQIGERIGIGSYGEVYRADWNDTEVAVKKFLVQDFTGDVLFQFKCEAEMMIRLRHPNVVLFMGAVTRPPNLSILTEFLPRGSLFRLLHRSGARIDEKKRMKMALDVAKGMNYLHTSHPTIVHRDLKSPNLLVDKNWVVKVCDFGLSRLKHHTFLSSNSTAGTPEWMAPEVLRNEPSNEKCDVYSFGVILWELATLYVPWSVLNPMQVVGAVGFQNRRLEIPAYVDPMVTQIIRDCWENDPRVRPSFSQLISRLKGLRHLVVQRD